MLNDGIIVNSAVSAFNNAALAAPAFLWWAILALPLFVLVYNFGAKVSSALGWTGDGVIGRASLWTVLLTAMWIVLMGGNYGVLRDAATLLPMMTAAVLFAASLFIGSNTRDVALPRWRDMSRGRRAICALGLLVFIALVARSDMHAWWGPVLQVGVVALGLVMGRAARGRMRAVPGVVLVTMATTTAMLMQPEYFRFGQLGELSAVHLMCVMLVGVFAAATVALRNVNPRGRVHHSAYVKLKWMARCICLLAIALFLLTESVPVFLGATVALFLSFAMSVWHGESVAPYAGTYAFALLLVMFGVITVMPVVTAMGVLMLSAGPRGNLWHELKFLL